MKITEKKISVADLVENYSDDGDGGVYGYNNRLTIRPAFQREFVYNEKQRNAVIETVRKNFPLNIMYWSKSGEDTYEMLDGQQRTISIGQYVNKDFTIKVNGNDKFFHNMTAEEQQQLLDYEITIYICEGDEAEKLEWFKIINIAGEVLTAQELRNAVYTGSWLADAKNYFSKRNCVAGQFADGYIKGNPIRQQLLEKALSWIIDKYDLESIEQYMALHQNDEDANELWLYFNEVISWAKRLFPQKQKGITDVQEWGLLYNKYKDKDYNTNKLAKELEQLLIDDDVTKKSGIVAYILSDKTKHDEKHLSIRAFTEAQKHRAYTKQNGICPKCGKHFEYEEMHGDHIIPWSQGGRTLDNNLQMLCQVCNNDKSDN